MGASPGRRPRAACPGAGLGMGAKAFGFTGLGTDRIRRTLNQWNGDRGLLCHSHVLRTIKEYSLQSFSSSLVFGVADSGFGAPKESVCVCLSALMQFSGILFRFRVQGFP